MTRQCLNAMRRRKVSERMKAIQAAIATLPAEQKLAALDEYKALNERLQRLKLS